MAPEVLNRQPYDTKADVYSFAVLLYYLLTKTEPFAVGFKHTWGECSSTHHNITVLMQCHRVLLDDMVMAMVMVYSMVVCDGSVTVM